MRIFLTFWVVVVTCILARMDARPDVVMTSPEIVWIVVVTCSLGRIGASQGVVMVHHILWKFWRKKWTEHQDFLPKSRASIWAGKMRRLGRGALKKWAQTGPGPPAPNGPPKSTDTRRGGDRIPSRFIFWDFWRRKWTEHRNFWSS